MRVLFLCLIFSFVLDCLTLTVYSPLFLIICIPFSGIITTKCRRYDSQIMSFRFQMYTCPYSPSSLHLSIFDCLILVAVICTATIGLWLIVSHVYLDYERILILESYILRLILSYINSFSVEYVISTLSILILILFFSSSILLIEN